MQIKTNPAGWIKKSFRINVLLASDPAFTMAVLTGAKTWELAIYSARHPVATKVTRGKAVSVLAYV